MKMTHAVLALSCALSLAACHGSLFFADANAAKSKVEDAEVKQDGTLFVVPEASPLRQRLVVSGVEKEIIAQVIDAPGVVEAAPEKLVKMTPPLAGRIVRLHHQLGDVVKAGEPLITIDSPEFGAAYGDQIKADAALVQAQQEFDRQKMLHEEGIVSARDFEAAQLALSEAQSDARATSDHLAQLGVAAGKGSRREYVLRAPMAGRVVEMEGFQGGHWNDNTASVMTIADLSTVWLSASVPEKDLAKMAIGQNAKIVPNAYAAQAVEGKVKYISDLLDPDTRTAKIRVDVDNKDGLFKPGMFARVSFSGEARPAVMVPATALLQSGLHTRVFVEQEPFRYESRIVEVGRTVGDRVEVLAGLTAGERVVVKNGVLLND